MNATVHGVPFTDNRKPTTDNPYFPRWHFLQTVPAGASKAAETA
jgi:hypothetical protein